MVVGEQKRIGTELHYIARAADNASALQEARYEILQALAFPRRDDFVAAAKGFVRRTVERDEEGVFDRLGRIRFAEIIEPERGTMSRKPCVR
jgi:hypothetical protein